MSITNELRKAITTLQVKHTHNDHDFTDFYYPSPSQREFTAIADRIDAEHAEVVAKSDRQREQLAAMEDALRRRNEGELKRRWQREIDALRDERDELREAVRLSEAKASDMVELPKDADGKVIRIGDVLDNTHKDGFAAKAVIGISYHPGGKTCVEVDENRLRWHDPSRLRHHEPPTVEDVMVEFATDWESAQDGEDKTAVLKEYAAKLRLAESEGE